MRQALQIRPDNSALQVPEPHRAGVEATEPSDRTGVRRPSAELSGREKAAILVRLLISQGAQIDLSSLPEEMQIELTEQIAAMRLIDRETVEGVATEFVETLEQVALSFAGGVEGALSELEARLMLSPLAARRLRDLAAGSGSADPWERIAAEDLHDLEELLRPEGAEILAIVLSKLSARKAAALLGRMPNERARRATLAVSQSKTISPDIVVRIGRALALQLDQRPRHAFEAPPAERMGAILNLAPSKTRNQLLSVLDEEDGEFAAGVRKAIFTFGQIHSRVQPRDVPRVLRDVPQAELITALAASLRAEGTDEALSAEFLLANMSQRMANILREEVGVRGKVNLAHADEAMGAIADAVRKLMDTEIDLIDQDEQ